MWRKVSAACALGVSIWTLSAATTAGQGPQAQRARVQVQAPLMAGERVRVIVGVRAPFVPEGRLESPETPPALRGRAGREIARQMQATVLGKLAGLGVGRAQAFDTIPFLSMEVDATALAALGDMPEVESVVEDHVSYPTLSDSTAIVAATTAWARGFTGNGWAVAILDSGVQKTHPMMSGRVVAEGCYSFLGSCPGGATITEAAGSGEPCDMNVSSSCFHGTHVAGIAAGQSASLKSVAPDANVIALQIFSYTGGGKIGAYDSDIVRGLERVLTLRNQGMAIASANMSLGGGLYSAACDSAAPAVKAAIDNLRSVGIATVIATGNDEDKSRISFPACISTAVSVGSTKKDDTVSDFSNSSNLVHLLAPGSSIFSAYPGSQYATASGTSMATPHVAGAWAVLKQKSPSASVTTILNALANTGKPITDTNGIAKPRININSALDNLDGTGTPGAITSPSNGSELPGSTVTFQWSAGSNVSEFYLYVGTSPGAFNLYEGSQGVATSRTVAGLPTNGGSVYVRLFSKIAGTYHTRDYSYSTKTLAATPAAITSPSNGSTLGSATVTFQWNAGVGVTEYYLYVGTTYNGYDIYEGSQGTSQSRAVTMAATGQAIYVTLWSKINGVLHANRYSYTAYDGRAAIFSPSNGSTLPGSTVTFSWNYNASSGEHLYVGSAPGGYDIYDASQGTATSRQVVGIPTDGRNIYVRLWSRINGALYYRDYSYKAATLAPAPATMSSPSNGTTFSSTTVTFSWSTGVGVTQYHLYLGSTPGGYDIYDASQGTSTSRSVTNVPADGRPIYVTLWSRIDGAFHARQYTYTAVDGRASMTSPSPGATLGFRTQTFSWSAGVGVSEYHLYVGTTPGGFDIYDRAEGTNRSAFVSGIPTNMKPVYVRLWSKVNGIWRFRDYTYVAP